MHSWSCILFCLWSWSFVFVLQWHNMFCLGTWGKSALRTLLHCDWWQHLFEWSTSIKASVTDTELGKINHPSMKDGWRILHSFSREKKISLKLISLKAARNWLTSLWHFLSYTATTKGQGSSHLNENHNSAESQHIPMNHSSPVVLSGACSIALAIVTCMGTNLPLSYSEKEVVDRSRARIPKWFEFKVCLSKLKWIKTF